LTFNSSENTIIRITDLSGRLMNEIKLTSGVNSNLDCSLWVNGIYIISTENNLIDKFLKD